MPPMVFADDQQTLGTEARQFIFEEGFRSVL